MCRFEIRVVISIGQRIDQQFSAHQLTDPTMTIEHTDVTFKILQTIKSI